MPGRLTLAAALLSLLALAGCSGVVPKAQLTVSPNPTVIGQTVTLDGSASSNLLSEPGFSWDVDGDGGIDRFGTQRVEHQAYTTPGPTTVSLEVSQGQTFFIEQDVATQVVTVNDPKLPVPLFTASPNPVCPNGTVHFDASASRDPDGSIVNYKWDLDGDGTFETDTGKNPVATQTYGLSPGQQRVQLKVTDNAGLSTQRARIVVADTGTCPVPAAAVSAAAVEHKARFALTLKARRPSRGIHLVNGDRLTLSSVRARGSMRLRGLPTPLQRVRRAGFVANLSSSMNIRTHRLTAQGVALLDLRRNGHLCTSLTIRSRAGARSGTGKMQVVGGSGRARFIDGKAAYGGAARLNGPLRVRGRIEMERRAKGKGLTRDCKRLLPKR